MRRNGKKCFIGDISGDLAKDADLFWFIGRADERINASRKRSK
jgi:hypothetical protein